MSGNETAILRRKIALLPGGYHLQARGIYYNHRHQKIPDNYAFEVLRYIHGILKISTKALVKCT